MESILATWEIHATSNTTSVVLPDGCRDLIAFYPPDDNAYFMLSPLFDTAHSVTLNAGTSVTGIRFQPGTRIQEERLLTSLADNLDRREIFDRLSTLTSYGGSVEEALSYLSNARSVEATAAHIGVTPRTLQRLVLRETNRSPVYWLMLARARKAARALVGAQSLADIAGCHGYADQAHMSREFKRWFNISPASLRNRPQLLKVLFHAGYDGTDTGEHSSIKKPLLSDT